ncbi:SpoIIE family protein phosphatase [Nocardioides sp. YIM 152315]|uniref:SpoIIE family protein phosphatase n=1 Tax=Nocardioides sp. YIM 152315 TaxID=3031760 RepID=UPI0023DB5909|nr:SpoIIE family protein phosphatase [Nocardioides sp. YIM 152315]MDF1604537.1 SpoIIE family protein phosphatase [Nocardioides sp. YIM 152315]
MSESPLAPHTPAYGEVDLSTCESEPIHVPGAIQPHGVLLALDAELRCVVVSANCEELLGIPSSAAVGATLAALVGPALAAALEERIAAEVTTEPLVVRLDDLAPRAALVGAHVDVRHHRSGSRWIVEIEPISGAGANRLTYQSTRGAMARLAEAASVHELADQLAVEVRALLGFDRVMVYRFDGDWNGEVIAEERRADLNSFLGLHYPASDIPAQARRLYTINWTRLIADVGYTPVPLQPVLDPATRAPLDLSHAGLRSVSPIHIEYLANMGVTASMSISLVVDGVLWGLVACHHYSGPHRPSHEARAAAEFLGQVASQTASDRERADSRERTLAAQTVLARMFARISSNPASPLVSLMEDPELLTLVHATGAVLSYDGAVTRRGDIDLDDDTLQRIASTLEDPVVYATCTDRLDTLMPELAGRTSAAGVLRVGSAPDRWLMWLRPEQKRIVDWGGDPTNKALAAAEGPEVRLSPRKSFEKWREVVRGRSLPWAPWKLEAADALGKHIIGLLLSRSKEQIAMAESLQRSVVLDQTPEVAGLELAAHYRPASTFQLGGDWWDVFDLDDGSVAFVVGDVAGHGVSAASAMTQLRTALRAYLVEGHSPAAALDRLDHLMANLLDQRVATAVVGIVDAERTRISLANAGHPVPLLVTAQGARDLDVPLRPLLGVGAGEAVTVDVPLVPGAALLLYTDGLVERRGVDLRARTERLRALAGDTYAGSDFQLWLDRLLGLHEGGDDDTTLLALRLASPGDDGPSATQGA